jgi:D-arabinose 1-dehydrogenase-like Zn-dependent alcohol dehydrogenase
MRAAVLREYGEPLEIEDVERPEPAPDGVVVETEACGICRSDWHAWQGDWDSIGAKLPRGQILGHEPAGRSCRSARTSNASGRRLGRRPVRPQRRHLPGVPDRPLERL